MAASGMCSDGPGRDFCTAAAKKKETKMFPKAEKVFKERK